MRIRLWKSPVPPIVSILPAVALSAVTMPPPVVFNALSMPLLAKTILPPAGAGSSEGAGSFHSTGEPNLANLTMRQMVDWLLVGATESVGEGKVQSKVVTSSVALLMKSPFKLQAEAVEGLIEGACNVKQFLSKQFAKN